MNRRRRRSRYKFTEKTHSKKGMGAIAVAVILIVMLVVFIYKAYKGDGNLSTYYGSAGVLALILSIIDLAIAISSTKEETSFMLFPSIAVVTSIISVLCWGGMYVAGFLG